MPVFTELCKERLGFGTAVPPQTGSGSTYDSGSLDMDRFDRAIFVLMTGVAAATSTVNMKLQESADNITFTDVTGGSGNAITQLTNGDNDIVTIEIRTDQLSSGKRYCRVRVTVAVDTCLIAVLPIGVDTIYHPATQWNAAAVVEEVVKVSA